MQRMTIGMVAMILLMAGSAFSQEGYEALAWGKNSSGQCNIDQSMGPYTDIAAGSYHTLLLTAEGTIVGFGNNGYGQLNIPSPNQDWVAVAVGLTSTSLGLKEDGTIVAWGDNSYGQCNVPEPNEGFVAVAGGGYHTLALKEDGSIVAWGSNLHGESNVPSPNEGFVAVAGGSLFSLALKEDGSIVAWGTNYHGQLNVPEPNEGFVAIAAGTWHSVCLREDGSIEVFGSNVLGQTDPPPGPNENFVAVGAGMSHSMGLKEDGTIVAWGVDDYGAYDFGQVRNTPTEGGFVAITSGSEHNIALRPIETGTQPGGIAPEAGTLRISGVTPNPFAAHTSLTFTSPGLADVSLEVFDSSGRLVYRQTMDEAGVGQHTLVWAGTDHSGSLLPNGVYTMRLSDRSEVSTTRAVLVR